MKLQDELKNAGLNEKEAAVYLSSLELGETSISRIAKKAAVKRTTVYLITDSLKEKGLMGSFKKRNKAIFYAEDPRKIRDKLEDKKEAIEKIMPELLSLANFIDKKPNIRYYEGTDGLKELFKDILKYPGQEVLEMYSEAYALDFEEKFFSEYFTPKRVEKKIWVRAILPRNEIIMKLVNKNQKELRQTKLLDPEKYKIKIEINIYANKISIISFKEKIGLIIESPKIYESMKNIFELMWESVL